MTIIKKLIAFGVIVAGLVLLWGTWRNNTGLISRATLAVVFLVMAAAVLWGVAERGPVAKLASGAIAMALVLVAFRGSCTVPVGDPVRYVALGDSFASGEGARAAGESYTRFVYFGDGSPKGATNDEPPCHRSVLAYPGRLADRIGQTTWWFAACTGAVIADICRSPGPDAGSNASCDAPGSPSGTGVPPKRPGTPAQLDQLRLAAAYGPIDVVTVMVGGNDLGFADLLSRCITSRCLNGPSAAPALFEEQLKRLPAALRTTYGAIRSIVGSQVPVLVVGYPRILPGAEDHCGSTAGLSVSERDWINEATRKTDMAILEAATAAGAFFVDTYNAFDRHLVCSGRPFAHGLVTPGVDNFSQVGDFDPLAGAFHPTPEGHQCLATTILEEYPEPTRLDPASIVDASDQPGVGSATACR